MARSKGAAPDKAASSELPEKAVFETAAEVRQADEVVCESARGEQENSVYAVVMSGVSKAQEAFKAVPSVGEGARKVAYRGIYYASYGATFGALVVARLVPANGFVGHAVADGAKAAKTAFQRQQAAEVARQTAEEGAPMPA